MGKLYFDRATLDNILDSTGYYSYSPFGKDNVAIKKKGFLMPFSEAHEEIFSKMQKKVKLIKTSSELFQTALISVKEDLINNGLF